MPSSIPDLDERTVKYLNESGIADKQAMIGTRLAEDRADIDDVSSGLSSLTDSVGDLEDAVESLQDEVAILSQDVRCIPVAAGTFQNDFFACPNERTLVLLEGRVDGSLSTGDFSLTVQKGSGESLIDNPPLDAKVALSGTFATIPLTSTVLDRTVAEGVSIKSQLQSTSGGAGASTVVLRFTWA